jgi:Flp pilus assembly protein TadD
MLCMSLCPQDFDNACSAYDQALKLDNSDYLTHLNYAITLVLNDEVRMRLC